MPGLWDKMTAVLSAYVALFERDPELPVTADMDLYTQLLDFTKEAEAEKHPSAGEVMYLANGQYVTLRPLEAIRILLQLKQRRTRRDVGKVLVDRIEFALRPRSYPVRNMDSAKLPQALKAVADLAGFPTYSGFQVAAWNRVLTAVLEADTVLLTAPTGAGKTEAFMLPLVRSAADHDHHFIIVYPRRELIKDQVGRLLRVVSAANDCETPANHLIIGVQLGGIAHTLQDALWNEDDSMLRVRCRGCGQHLRKVRTGGWACGCRNKFMPPFYWSANDWWYNAATKSWSRRGTKPGQQKPDYLFLLETLDVEWPDVLTCPRCESNTSLRSTVSAFLTADSGKGAPVRFCCPDCGFEAPLSLSKEHHIKVRPHFLVTNVESLDKLLLDPRYKEAGYFKAIDGVAMDEVHVYHTLYGAHVHHLLRRLEKHKGHPCALIGLSATIPQPAEFGERLFGRPIRHLVEAGGPEFPQESLSAEYFLFLRVPDEENVAALSTMLQTVMALGHAVLPANSTPTSGSQVMVFSDSLDVIIRAQHQLEDAEGSGRLYKLRMEDGADGPYPCVGLDHARCPKLPDGSYCPTYLKGECWRLFWEGDIREQPLEVTSVHAALRNGMQAAREADVIISSPSLEVGVDLPTVGSTVHYKTPRAVFSFIQRKGRAGRKPGQFPFTVAVLAGNDPMDAFYFQQFTRLVKGEYQLPLNPENPVIETIHSEYLDGTFSGPVMDTYLDLVGSAEFRRYPQSALRPTGWSVVREQASCPRWLDEVELPLPPAVAKGQAMELAEKQLAELIRRKTKQIADLKAQFGKPVEDRAALTDEIDRGLAELVAHIPEQVRDLDEFKGVLEEAHKALMDLKEVIAQTGSLGEKQDEVIGNLADLYDIISPIGPKLFRQKANTALARQAAGLLIGSVDELRNQIGGDGLLEAADQISDLRYQVAALEKLHGVVKSKLKLPAEIVKRYQQAQFYLCWSCKRWSTCDLPQRMHYFIPETYFDNPANLIVDLAGGDKYEEASFMLYSTYVPWKIFYRFGGDPITVRTVSVPAGFATDGTPLADVTLEGMDGIWDYFDGQPFFMPRKIQAVKVAPVEIPQMGNRYRICPGCYSLALEAEPRCRSCGSSTVLASVYGAPVVQRRFLVKECKDTLKRLSLCQIDGLTQVTATDVSYRTQQMAEPKSFRARYTVPLGYRYETRGLVLDLADALKEASEALLHPETARDTAIRNAALEANSRWALATTPDATTLEVTLLHTAAHMLVKAVSGMCGVNEESVEYAWNPQGQVAVWEKYTGGAGIADLFISYVRNQPADVYHQLAATVECKHCKCSGADGCPDSVWISYCQAGRREQGLAVSASLGALLLACLTRRVPVHGGMKPEELVRQGGPLLVDVVDDGKTAVCLEL